MTDMTLPVEDRILIHELISLHGHLCDSGRLDRFGEVFSDDIAYDVEDLGFGVLHGLEGLRDAALALGDANPVAHHVTNIVITAYTGETVQAMSKGLGIGTDGVVNSVVYLDDIRRLPQGWRIVRRKLLTRRRPLHQ